MPLELKTWYTLSRVSASPETLSARFLPDYFLREAAPALNLTIEHPTDSAVAAVQLERFRNEECVVEISVESGAVALWAEYDEEPTRLLGKRITHSWSAYSAEEALKIASSLQDQLAATQSENAALERNKQELEEFISELLRRAEAKKILTTKNTAATDGQIDALKRVLNRFTGA